MVVQEAPPGHSVWDMARSTGEHSGLEIPGAFYDALEAHTEATAWERLPSVTLSLNRPSEPGILGLDSHAAAALESWNAATAEDKPHALLGFVLGAGRTPIATLLQELPLRWRVKVRIR